jgi:hypothetical protein
MSVLDGLSSVLGTRSQDANARVAEQCLASPPALTTIAAALAGKDPGLVGDCAEVLTKVGERQPELLAPHAELLLGLLAHRNGRVRWESAHALALVASRVPRLIHSALPRLAAIVRDDTSVIVRDYVLDAIAGHGATGPKAADEALPILAEGLDVWQSKHAARVLRALPGLAAVAAKLGPEIRALAARFTEDPRPGVRKAALAVLASAAGPPKHRTKGR